MEKVFIVERRDFFAGSWPQGFRPMAPATARAFLTELAANGRFVDRADAEVNPAWKQTIPYCAVRRGAELFCVERMAKQGESRLHGQLSIGIGGHINPIDDRAAGTGAEFFLGALGRELDEELVLPEPLAATAQFAGLLNHDSNPVGAVHVGLIYLLDVPLEIPRESVGIRETTKMRGGFRGLVGPSGLWQDSPRFETWSRVLLRSSLLDMAVPTTEPPA